MAGPESLQANIRGRVQGVFFRDFVRIHAGRLGLSGYVRNLPDGSVEVRAEGDRADLEKLLEHLKKGPPAARVEEVRVEWSASAGKYLGFDVRY
jgi:acylphosphatase